MFSEHEHILLLIALNYIKNILKCSIETVSELFHFILVCTLNLSILNVDTFCQAKVETRALKAKRPGFTDERYNETTYYRENGN